MVKCQIYHDYDVGYWVHRVGGKERYNLSWANPPEMELELPEEEVADLESIQDRYENMQGYLYTFCKQNGK